MKSPVHQCFAAMTSALLLATGSAFAAHESNNYALLREAPAADVQGQAIINYVAGTESWNGNVRVTGLPEGTYLYAVSLNNGTPQEVCMFTVNRQGNGSCSSGKFDLTGFNMALIFDMDDNLVLSGSFERRGGNREK